MLTLDEIRAGLQDRRPGRVAKAVGVHRQTIYNVLEEGANPTHATLKKLSDYLQGQMA